MTQTTVKQCNYFWWKYFVIIRQKMCIRDSFKIERFQGQSFVCDRDRIWRPGVTKSEPLSKHDIQVEFHYLPSANCTVLRHSQHRFTPSTLLSLQPPSSHIPCYSIYFLSYTISHLFYYLYFPCNSNTIPLWTK